MNYWIWFSNIKGLGVKQKKILLEKVGSPDKIFKEKIENIEKIDGIHKNVIENWEQSKDILLLNRYEKYMEEHEIMVISIEDKSYPAALKEIYDAPITLYAKGDISLLGKKSIAMVGCRKASSYGLKIAKDLAYQLAEKHIVIVSGLAKGIDAASHTGALTANGETVAVLGCGIDICYPQENISIYKDIMKNGLLLSEYIVGTSPDARNFPARNRIISGLSNGVLVIEAEKKSGSLITADFALEQGREVYAIPGNISSLQSEGTNELIKQGAKVVTNIQDVLEDL